MPKQRVHGVHNTLEHSSKSKGYCNDRTHTKLLDHVPLVLLNGDFWYCKIHIERFFGMKNLTQAFKARNDIWPKGSAFVTLRGVELKEFSQLLWQCSGIDRKYLVSDKTNNLTLFKTCTVHNMFDSKSYYVKYHERKNLSWPNCEQARDATLYKHVIDLGHVEVSCEDGDYVIGERCMSKKYIISKLISNK